MKERESGKNFFKKALEVWTKVSIPIEVGLLGVGVITHNRMLVVLSALGLGVDILTLGVLNRNKNKESANVSAEKLSEIRGASRVRQTYSPYSNKLVAAAA